MRWRKQGLIFSPSGKKWWARSYALIPTAEILNDDTLRIYFASLDERQLGRIGYVDIDSRQPSHILSEASEPVLDIGPLGTFDDSGVNPSCIVTAGDKKYFYYIGWQRCERVPYMLFAGLAISDDGMVFNKSSPVPVLDRTAREPFIRSAMSVLREEQSWKAWYVSGVGWTVVKDRQYPRYVVRYAESPDGITWSQDNLTCIDFESDDEFGFGRPWVIRDDDRYRMWYSIRSTVQPYRIGYAESTDGRNWLRRDDQAGIQRSANGWDSEMICYPCVIDVHGERYMFYNGNRHGSTGFGYAVLER